MKRIEQLKGVKIINQIYESVINSYDPLKGGGLNSLIDFDINEMLIYNYQFEEVKNVLTFEDLDDALNDINEWEGGPTTARDMIIWALRKIIRELILSDLDEREEV